MEKVTKEQLYDAVIAMKLASMDYDDNSGSSESDDFWTTFCYARNEYLRLKEIYNGYN